MKNFKVVGRRGFGAGIPLRWEYLNRPPPSRQVDLDLFLDGRDSWQNLLCNRFHISGCKERLISSANKYLQINGEDGKMIKKLVKLAGVLDKNGFIAEADYLDLMIRKISSAIIEVDTGDSAKIELGEICYYGRVNHKLYHECLNLDECKRENLEDLIKKVLAFDSVDIYYFKNNSESDAFIHNGKIKFHWSLYQEDDFLRLSTALNEKFGQLFDLDVQSRMNKVLKEIEIPIGESSRSNSHMVDVFHEEIEKIVSSNASQAEIQDFVNGFYSAAEGQNYVPESSEQRSSYWWMGFNVRRAAALSGAVAMNNAEYIAENNWDAMRRNSDITEEEIQYSRGVDPDIAKSERINKSLIADFGPGVFQNIQETGRYFLDNGDLSELDFGKGADLSASLNVSENSYLDENQTFLKYLREELNDLKTPMNAFKALKAQKNIAKEMTTAQEELAGRYIIQIQRHIQNISGYIRKAMENYAVASKKKKKAESLKNEVTSALNIISGEHQSTLKKLLDGYDREIDELENIMKRDSLLIKETDLELQSIGLTPNLKMLGSNMMDLERK